MTKGSTRIQSESRFVLHRFNGDEIYRFEYAIIWPITENKLCFSVKANPEAILRCEDTLEAGTSPKAEVTVTTRNLDLDELVGKTLFVQGTQRDDEDSADFLFYYFEHEALRMNEIAVVSRNSNRLWVRWTAQTKDVIHYDGSKPVTEIEIEGEFLFVKDIRKWMKEHPDC